MPLKTVLAGTSLSDTSRDVVAAAWAIAQPAGAQLIVVHGFEVPLQYYGAGPYEVAPTDPAVYETIEEQHRRMLDEQVQSIAGSSARAELRLGGGAGVLLDMAEEIHPDLVVVGASERGHLEERLTGSTADRVIRGAHVPVLAIRHGAHMPPRSVLLPVDFSADSDAAFLRSLDFLDSIGSPAALTALFVLGAPQGGGGAPFTHDQMRELSQTNLEKLCKEAGVGDRPVPATVIREGHPADEIVAQIEESHPDLVVLGTHGRGGFRRFLLGSVATTVTRRSPASCLIVPPRTSH